MYIGRKFIFFDKELNLINGVEWYEAHFSKDCQKRFVREKTPDYLWANGIGVEGYLPFVHKNIYSYLPEAKLILFLGNPVDRAISAVHHMVRTGRFFPLFLFNIGRLLLGKKKRGKFEYTFNQTIHSSIGKKIY